MDFKMEIRIPYIRSPVIFKSSVSWFISYIAELSKSNKRWGFLHINVPGSVTTQDSWNLSLNNATIRNKFNFTV